MTHKEIKEHLQLLLYNEIESAERVEVEQHLSECKECQKEFVQLKRMFEIIATERTPELTEQLIEEARKELHTSLITHKTKPSTWKGIQESIDSLISSVSLPSNLPRYVYAFGGAAVDRKSVV